jgi:hypothetical protein
VREEPEAWSAGWNCLLPSEIDTVPDWAKANGRLLAEIRVGYCQSCQLMTVSLISLLQWKVV